MTALNASILPPQHYGDEDEDDTTAAMEEEYSTLRGAALPAASSSTNNGLRLSQTFDDTPAVSAAANSARTADASLRALRSRLDST